MGMINSLIDGILIGIVGGIFIGWLVVLFMTRDWKPPKKKR